MTILSALLLAILGGLCSALGGFIVGRWLGYHTNSSLELRAGGPRRSWRSSLCSGASPALRRNHARP